MKRCFLVVIDSLGVGEAPDADKYGDLGTNTLSNVANAVGGVNLPTMEKLGFGKITEVKNMDTNHIATVGRLSEVSVGNDSTTGHWEIAGLVTTHKFQTFPDGFEFYGSTAEKYKQIGNAVPVTFAEAIGRAIGHHFFAAQGYGEGALRPSVLAELAAFSMVSAGIWWKLLLLQWLWQGVALGGDSRDTEMWATSSGGYFTISPLAGLGPPPLEAEVCGFTMVSARFWWKLLLLQWFRQGCAV